MSVIRTMMIPGNLPVDVPYHHDDGDDCSVLHFAAAQSRCSIGLFPPKSLIATSRVLSNAERKDECCGGAFCFQLCRFDLQVSEVQNSLMNETSRTLWVRVRKN